MEIVSIRSHVILRSIQIFFGLLVFIVALQIDFDALNEELKVENKKAIGITSSLFTFLAAGLSLIIQTFPSKLDWERRTVFWIDLVVDILMTGFLLYAVWALLSNGVGCSPGIRDCDLFNTVMVFSVFTLISWIFHLILQSFLLANKD